MDLPVPFISCTRGYWGTFSKIFYWLYRCLSMRKQFWEYQVVPLRVPYWYQNRQKGVFRTFFAAARPIRRRCMPYDHSYRIFWPSRIRWRCRAGPKELGVRDKGCFWWENEKILRSISSGASNFSSRDRREVVDSTWFSLELAATNAASHWCSADVEWMIWGSQVEVL